MEETPSQRQSCGRSCRPHPPGLTGALPAGAGTRHGCGATGPSAGKGHGRPRTALRAAVIRPPWGREIRGTTWSGAGLSPLPQGGDPEPGRTGTPNSAQPACLLSRAPGGISSLWPLCPGRGGPGPGPALLAVGLSVQISSVGIAPNLLGPLWGEKTLKQTGVTCQCGAQAAGSPE